MTRPPRARIRLSFERAASTYDEAAVVQRHICDHLAAALAAAPDAKLVLDAGCGTGYAHGLLRQRFPDARLLALDLSLAMLKRVDGDSQRLAGDLEQLPLGDSCLDLYWSSLAMQWCDPGLALSEARRILRPTGRLAISTLGPATFHELRTAFRGVDAHEHTLAFHCADDIRRQAESAGFNSVTLESRRETLHYPDLRSLLRAVKAAGANQLGAGRRTGLMSPGALRQLETAYEHQRQAGGLPLTYDIIYLHASP
jgi:malonyl-CoA O-methyltransferase